MKRTLVKTVGVGLFLLGIGVFLNPLRPIRKGDSAVMARAAVEAYREAKPEVAENKEFQRVESSVERLANWSLSQTTDHGVSVGSRPIVLFATGLFLVHIGSWIPTLESKRQSPSASESS